MRSIFHPLGVWLALSALLVAGCRTTPRPDTVDLPATNNVIGLRIAIAKLTDSEKLALAHARYADGVLHDIRGETAAATEDFYLAAIYDADDESLALEVSGRLILAHQLDKALDVLEAAASYPDASGAIYARLGLVYSELGKTDKAVEAGHIAIRKSPGSLAGYQTLFQNYLQSKRPAEALKLLDTAATQTNADMEFLTGLADLYVNYTLQFPSQREAVERKGVALVDRAAALKDSSPQLRLKLADDYAVFGQSQKAAALYQEVVNDFDDMPMVRDAIRAKLVDIYLQAHQDKRAIGVLQDIIRDDPSNAQAYFYLGGLAYDNEQWADAADNLQKAILFNPDLEQAYYDLASAQLALEKPEEALATLDKARQFHPRFVSEYLRGIAEMRLKNYPAAIDKFTSAELMGEAGETDRLTGTFYFQLAAAYERNGQYDQAGKYFKKCLQLSPDFSEGLNYLGYMWAEHNTNLIQARELIGRALKSEPTNAAYLDSMGWVLYKLKQPEQALDFLLKAVHFSPEPDETLYDHLGDIYAALHRMDKAREAWRKSVAVVPDPAVQKKLDAAKPP